MREYAGRTVSGLIRSVFKQNFCAGERIRTSTTISGHQLLRLGRLPVPPRLHFVTKRKAKNYSGQIWKITASPLLKIVFELK